jgi:hypothetical protein
MGRTHCLAAVFSLSCRNSRKRPCDLNCSLAGFWASVCLVEPVPRCRPASRFQSGEGVSYVPRATTSTTTPTSRSASATLTFTSLVLSATHPTNRGPTD